MKVNVCFFFLVSGAGGVTDVVVVTVVVDVVAVEPFFTKDVKVGPFKSNNPVNQNRQRSVVPSGTSTTVQG